MMDTMRRMSAADQAGFQARSPEGHAARSMSIKGQEEVWIQIQANTFKNWANVSLREAGIPGVEDLLTGFQDGTKLVALVETLQKRRLKHNKKPLNQHHELENISIALDAIQEDGIKLVNIGKKVIISSIIMIFFLYMCLKVNERTFLLVLGGKSEFRD